MPEQQLDPCVTWIEGWVTLKLGCKQEKFRKLMGNEDASRPIMNFIENPECLRLLVMFKDKAELACADIPTGPLKGKAAVFLKVERAPLRPETLDTNVLAMDLLPDALSQLYRTCQEMYLPMLSNHENQQGWPSVV
eukprot:2353682-Prymnesium_polylepis.1